MRLLSAFVLLGMVQSPALLSQWEMQTSGSTASFRGIDALDARTAWASGTRGTVLRTVDGGKTWQTCALPTGAEKLDFRGIQAFDADTAVIMSSGKGDFSRVYKTTDSCKSWKLVISNPDLDGFWNAIVFEPTHRIGIMIGDPVRGKFQILVSCDAGNSWQVSSRAPEALPGEAGFAASNSSVSISSNGFVSVSGGARAAMVDLGKPAAFCQSGAAFQPVRADLPLPHNSSSGPFSVYFAGSIGVVVGGDYQKPDDSAQTAAFTLDGGKTWATSVSPPHGYRSSVTFDAAAKMWICTGTNGTDISRDNGRTWRPLLPGAGEPPDADRKWNAISLPFFVGPAGRIGKLRPNALQP